MTLIDKTLAALQKKIDPMWGTEVTLKKTGEIARITKQGLWGIEYWRNEKYAVIIDGAKVFNYASLRDVAQFLIERRA